MSKAAQLKKRASEFEQKKQYDRALATYAQAIDAAAGLPEEIDIPLYNRVGDLHLRLGDVEQAVAYYEMAVDLYAEGGFFNNAIALCNKVLRHAPDRSSIYYKLGKISARKGFNSDAKQNFLEYADRMQKSGQLDEAFRALKEFADLCPGHDDVRLMLAEQFAKAGRKEEALEQLQLVHDTMVAEERTTEAAATLERMRAIDPTVEPRRAQSQRPTQREGLVFIDVNDAAPAARAGGALEGLEPTSLATEPVPRSASGRPLTPLEFAAVELPPPADPRVRKTLDDTPLSGLTPLEDPVAALTPTGSEADDASPAFVPSIVDEPTTFDASYGGDGVTAAPEYAHEQEGMRAPEAMPVPEPPRESVREPVAEPTPEPPAEPVAETVPEPAPELVPEPVWSPPPAVRAATPAAPAPDDDFVDLQAWLRDTAPPKNSRMTAEGVELKNDGSQSESDFTSMLETFKRGVAENVEESDSDSQYDLGVAYMEMGLVDEAISQFQKALRGDSTPERRVRAHESLGQCFIELQRYDIAIESLRRALEYGGADDAKLVGVLYLLGYASESLGRWDDAASYYKRVFAVDIRFRDTAERLPRALQAVGGTA